MDYDEMFHDDGTMTVDLMNRALALIYAGKPAETLIEIHKFTGRDAEAVRKFWAETIAWLEANPLKPGQSYDTLPV